MNEHTHNTSITLGGGCFWCIEAVLQRLKGVHKVQSGYANGLIDSPPDYREVCRGQSGFVEVVKVDFDPQLISLEDLLRIFMLSHDPCSLNRQGADVGTQYRSGIYYATNEQKAIAEKVIAELATQYERPIVTELEPLKHFFPAEDYHQDYYNNNPNAGYCRIVIEPKILKLKAYYQHLLNTKR